mmetsp:Transcript_17054/g.43688  ORF Transcript_17054/g.43688 Transcript_17054/m.43688 type:complete len:247 (+) Transcript_17054:576-1316(+)
MHHGAVDPRTVVRGHLADGGDVAQGRPRPLVRPLPRDHCLVPRAHAVWRGPRDAPCVHFHCRHVLLHARRAAGGAVREDRGSVARMVADDPHLRDESDCLCCPRELLAARRVEVHTGDSAWHSALRAAFARRRHIVLHVNFSRRLQRCLCEHHGGRIRGARGRQGPAFHLEWRLVCGGAREAAVRIGRGRSLHVRAQGAPEGKGQAGQAGRRARHLFQARPRWDRQARACRDRAAARAVGAAILRG